MRGIYLLKTSKDSNYFKIFTRLVIFDIHACRFSLRENFSVFSLVHFLMVIFLSHFLYFNFQFFKLILIQKGKRGKIDSHDPLYQRPQRPGRPPRTPPQAIPRGLAPLPAACWPPLTMWPPRPPRG